MSAYTTDIAAVANRQIQHRVHEAEARRIAKAARTSTTPDVTAPSHANRSRSWIRFIHRAYA
jgi:hypothetical protein